MAGLVLWRLLSWRASRPAASRLASRSFACPGTAGDGPRPFPFRWQRYRGPVPHRQPKLLAIQALQAAPGADPACRRASCRVCLRISWRLLGGFANGAFNSYFLITYKDGLLAFGTSSVRLTGSVTTINATCQVADQIVKLQSIAAAQLNGVGTYAAVTPFNLAVAGCLRGYYRVGYNLQAVGAWRPKPRVCCRAWRAVPRPAYRSGSPTR